MKNITRRCSFKGAAAVIAGLFLGFCRKAAEAADSWFRWPSYPSTEALRRHIATSSRHPRFGWNDVRGKSRAQLIAIHDGDHFRKGNKAPLKKTTSSSTRSKSSPSKSKPKKSNFKSLSNWFRTRR